MKLFLLFIVFIFLNYTATSQVNDEQAYLLRAYDKSYIQTNRVKTVKVKIDIAGNTIRRQFTFDSAGNLIHVASINAVGKLQSESHFKVDPFGETVFYKSIDFEKGESDSAFYERAYSGNKLIKESSFQIGYSKEYFYNEKGQLQKTITTNDREKCTITSHSYDSMGNDIEHTWLQNGTKKVTKKVYDNLSRLTEYQKYFYSPDDSVGKLFLHKKLTYGVNGKIAKEEYLGGYFDLDKDKEEYTYGQNGNLIEYKKGEDKQNFTYDSKGYLIKKVTLLFGGSIQSVETYSYTFYK